MQPPEIQYRNGLAVLRHVREAPPFMSYDARADAWVAPGHRLAEVRAWAAQRGIVEALVAVEDDDVVLFDPRVPRDYQRDAVDRWRAGGGRGSVVLPTGAGKSFVAILAIHETGTRACVVAPTRALVTQWYAQLVDAFGAERVGAWYGDEKVIAQVTVTTYHSLFALLERHGAQFNTLVLDEAHHLADTASGDATAWQDALRIAPSPHRLALTATYPDERDAGLRALVGPVVYRRAVGEMTDAELSAFVRERRFVRFNETERRRYDACNAAYQAFVAERGYRERYEDRTVAWKVFMAETRRSAAARRAHRAFQERERLIALPEAKLRETARLLRLFRGETALVFCGSTDAAERVSRHFALPMITANTPASERKALLDRIESGAIRGVASVRVLDEGWDVPSAKLGIVLGDSTKGSKRQHAQRLGRLLRRQGERVASLFEVVVSDTHEFYTAQKRGAGLGRPAGQLGLGF
ncbi:MAG TPA: DEAD/DEAH box helicase [Longimicrobiales bacterium]|nr:DEAD/DEAH box helicase [Longimicrobiales bacterium]